MCVIVFGSLTNRLWTDVPSFSTPYGFSAARTVVASSFYEESQAVTKTMWANPKFILNTFPLLNWCPNLRNNTKCYLFATYLTWPRSLLHYSSNCEAWQSQELCSDLLFPSYVFGSTFSLADFARVLTVVFFKICVGRIVAMLLQNTRVEQQHHNDIV